MKRLLAVLVVLCILITGMLGCSNPEPAPNSAPESQSALPESTPEATTEGGELTLWSHWADEVGKVKYIETSVANFEAANPDWTVEITWYPKADLITALTTGFQSGTSPNVFYCEPYITGGFPNYVDSGYCYDIGASVDEYVSDWCAFFTKDSNGMTYILPVEAYGAHLYVNEDVVAECGYPAGDPGYKLTEAELLDLVKVAREKGYTPFSAGTMDRAWCGQILMEYVILRHAGQEKWQGIATGATSWTDEDVVAAVEYVEELVGAKAYPEGVASIGLGDSHYEFFSGQYALFPMRDFFGGRAFVPESDGGIPSDFNLAIMAYPTAEGGKGNDLGYQTIGGSFAVSSQAPNPEMAAQVIYHMAQPEMANIWLSETKCPTGLKADMDTLDSEYLKDLIVATGTVENLPGPMALGMNPDYRDRYFELSTGLVNGLISADDMLAQLEEYRLTIA